jgi:soluble cytochrome b562
MVKVRVKERVQPTVSQKASSAYAAIERTVERFKLPVQWQLWGSLAIAISTTFGAIGYTTLLHQPSVPRNCDAVFWPFASASFRIYCAQAYADQGSLESLLRAIELINELSSDHPLRPEINRRIEIWARQVLDRANGAFHDGQLERAIKFAQRIPENTSAFPLVEKRIAKWREVWAEGKGIYERAEAALKGQDWRRAFQISLPLMDVQNRYWSDAQFQRLNQRIITAQMDDSKLGKARRLIRWGGFEDLVNALKLVRQIGPDRDFYSSARVLLNQIAEKLLGLAQAALAQQDLNRASEIAQQIPEDSKQADAAQDFLVLADAESWTWGNSVEGLKQAIAKAQTLAPNRPLYAKAQELIFAWQSDMQAVAILQQAEQVAQKGSIVDLQNAIIQAQQVPPTISPYRHKVVQTNLQDWTQRMQTLQDQPLLDRAEQLAATGELSDLRKAIGVALQISQGRALYAQAQERVKAWSEQLQLATQPQLPPPVAVPDEGAAQSQAQLQEAIALAGKGTPESLVQAMQKANQISFQSPARLQADEAINNWGEEVLKLARQQAEVDTLQAIAIAKQIPEFSGAYAEAQSLMQTWQDQL